MLLLRILAILFIGTIMLFVISACIINKMVEAVEDVEEASDDEIEYK